MAKVYVSSVVPAAAGAVWAVVRNFNGLPDWTGFVVESRIEQGLPADKIGCIRNFRLKDGGRIRERMLALSDYEMSCTYAILESPIGVRNYVATLRLFPITDGDQTFVEWTAEFEAAPDRQDQIADDIGRNVFGAALASLRSRFARQSHG
jgi:Polyketide cyclase / dehydrase and lipid transport